MPLHIVRNDITRMKVDAIVNSANPRPIVGGGVDRAIHRAAGPRLLQARQQIGPLSPGEAALSPGFQLPAAWVIHAVGPVWQGGNQGEAADLRRTYDRCLELALGQKCRSVAFPMISAGIFGYPRDQALQIALDAFRDFLRKQELEIYLVVFDSDTFRLSADRYGQVSSYIDNHYVSLHLDPPELQNLRCCQLSAPMPAPPPVEDLSPAADLAGALEQLDLSFSQYLMEKIRLSGKTDAEVYKRANIDRKLFSKIRNNPHYQPTKATALALAVGLELDLTETEALLYHAGFALTHSSKLDVIVEYFIQRQCYDIYEINAALFRFDQNLLGSQ